MTNEEAINVLSANVMFACDRALFDMATKRCIEDALDKAIDALEERKMGKWIRTAGDYIGDDVSGYYDYHWLCSECEREAITNDWNMYELSDYCPHCGAKMEGVTSDGL